MRRLALAIVMGMVMVAAWTTRAAVPTPLSFTYLGTAGWIITDGATIVLVDPYLTRLKDNTPNDAAAPEDTRPQINQGTLVTSDTAVIDKYITRADLILITHTHPDHALDMPYIARKTGATVVGTESTGNIARALDVPEKQIRQVSGHEDLTFGGVSVLVVPSIHGIFAKPAPGAPPRPIVLVPPTAKPPFRINSFAEGGTLAYLLRIGGHQVLIFGSMNYLEDEVKGLRPDIALIGAMPERANIDEYTPRLMRALGNPPIVLPTHWDRFNTPYELGQPQKAFDRVKAFADEVRAASPLTQVIIPEHLKPVTVGK